MSQKSTPSSNKRKNWKRNVRFWLLFVCYFKTEDSLLRREEERNSPFIRLVTHFRGLINIVSSLEMGVWTSNDVGSGSQSDFDFSHQTITQKFCPRIFNSVLAETLKKIYSHSSRDIKKKLICSWVNLRAIFVWTFGKWNVTKFQLFMVANWKSSSKPNGELFHNFCDLRKLMILNFICEVEVLWFDLLWTLRFRVYIFFV